MSYSIVMEIIEKEKVRDAWAVISNSDLIEGRGSQVILCLCESKATALRKGKGEYFMRSDCPVEKVSIFRYDGFLYGPVHLVTATKEDKIEDEKREALDEIKAKAIALGLSAEEIKTLCKN